MPPHRLFDGRRAKGHTMARTVSTKEHELAGARRIEDHLERQRLTFDALFRLVEKLGTTLEVSTIVSLFLMTLMGQLKVKRVSLYLAHPEHNRLEPFRSLGLAERAPGVGFALDSAFIRWLRESDGPVDLSEFLAPPDAGAHEEEEMVRRLIGMGFSRAMSLGEQGNPLGMLLYGDTVTGEAFSEFDAEFVKMLAGVASITIRNAFLYQAAVQSKIELEQFSEVKREFINHTSHELRTPLTVLKSALWSLEPDEAASGVLIDMARDAVLRLQGKVEYILSLNDIELNETDFRFEPSEVSSVVEDVLREMIPELEEKQVRVEVDDRARDRKALIDPGKMSIVVRSILDNAVNFVDRGGNITIVIWVSKGAPGEGEGVEIRDRRTQAAGAFDVPPISAPQAGYLVLSVKDDGIGIPQSEIENLAQPFTMASNSTNRNVKGLGIGLSVSQKVVAGHGGKIFCKSDLGQGAQFSVWLPLDL
jgi:signal transduction histidine kinase